MSHTLHQTEGGPAAQTLTPQPIQDDSLPLDVREHVQRLRLILPVIRVSVLALHRQNAELDAESILVSRAWRRRQEALT